MGKHRIIDRVAQNFDSERLTGGKDVRDLGHFNGISLMLVRVSKMGASSLVGKFAAVVLYW